MRNTCLPNELALNNSGLSHLCSERICYLLLQKLLELRMPGWYLLKRRETDKQRWVMQHRLDRDKMLKRLGFPVGCCSHIYLLQTRIFSATPYFCCCWHCTPFDTLLGGLHKHLLTGFSKDYFRDSRVAWLLLWMQSWYKGFPWSIWQIKCQLRAAILPGDLRSCKNVPFSQAYLHAGVATIRSEESSAREIRPWDVACCIMWVPFSVQLQARESFWGG